MSVFLDEFETAVYYALDDNPDVSELARWFDTFVELWQESNAQYFECGEDCEPDTCEDCDFFNDRDNEEPVYSEHEAAVSHAKALLDALGEDAPEGCTCGYIGQCDGCAEPLEPSDASPWFPTPEEIVALHDALSPKKVIVTTSTEDRLSQIESLLNRLFDEIRNLKALSPPDRWPAKTLPSTPSFPQQPYQPPPMLPYTPPTTYPHSPGMPWSSSPCVGGNTCRCGSH